MTAADEKAVKRSSHLSQPGEGAPLLREGPPSACFPGDSCAPSGTQAGRGKGSRSRRSRISTPCLSSVRPEIHTEKPIKPVVG